VFLVPESFFASFRRAMNLVGTVSRTSGCPSMSSITRSTRFPKPSVAVVPKILSFGSWKKGEVRDVLDVTEGEDKPALLEPPRFSVAF